MMIEKFRLTTSHPATSRTSPFLFERVEAARHILAQVSLGYQPDDSRGTHGQKRSKNYEKLWKIAGDDSANSYMFSFAGPSCLSTIHSQAQSNGIDYPFAVASINVTQHLARQFLAGWFKNESAMNRNIYRNCWGRIQKLTCIPCAIPLYSKDLGLGSVQCLGCKVLQSSKCMQMHYERHVVDERLLKVKWSK